MFQVLEFIHTDEGIVKGGLNDKIITDLEGL